VEFGDSYNQGWWEISPFLKISIRSFSNNLAWGSLKISMSAEVFYDDFSV
jgi:hypothetical protein